MTTGVGVCLSVRPWRAQLQRYCRDHVTDLAVHLIRDGADVFDGATQVVVLDDDTSWLSAPFVNRARDAAIAIIGIFDPAEADGHGRQHLRRLGVDAVLPASIGIEDLAGAIRMHLPDPEIRGRFDELVGATQQRVGRSPVIAVGGPAGAGATEVAVALATLVADRPLLVDLDETHPSLARRLGLGVHPHVVTAVEALRREQASFSDDEFPMRRCVSGSGGGGALAFDALAGLASRDDWGLLRPADALDLLDAAAGRWPAVIVRTGPNLEDLGRWVERFGVSRAALGRADRLIGVCDASAVGLLRFVDWLVDAVPLLDGRPIDVVLNRSQPGSPVTVQLEEQLREVAGERVSSVWAVPRDRRVERAQWAGRVVGRGPFLRSLRPAAEAVAATSEARQEALR